MPDDWLKNPGYGVYKSTANVLWVIFGRDRLQYDWEALDEIVLPEGFTLEDVTNPDMYIESKLHCLGNLTKEYADEFLQKVGIPDIYYEDIYNSTRGNPVWLDLVVDMYDLANSHNKKFVFDGIKNTESLTKRYFIYLDNAEKNAVVQL